MDLVPVHRNKVLGLISREEYWKEVQLALRNETEPILYPAMERNCLKVLNQNLILEISGQNKISMFVDTEDIRSAPFTIIAEGGYEPFLAEILFALIRASSVFFDIGANHGYYSLSAANLNPLVEVHAFEPNPIVFGKLQNNIALNQYQNQIICHNEGISNRTSSDESLFVPKFTGSGGGSLLNLHPSEGDPEILKIKLVEFDKVYPGVSYSIDLMKIDVEGAEYSVIQGGIKSISTRKPSIIIELLRKWMAPFGHHPQDVLEELCSLGYISYAISDNFLRKIENIDGSTIETNFLFIHPENLAHMNLIERFKFKGD